MPPRPGGGPRIRSSTQGVGPGRPAELMPGKSAGGVRGGREGDGGSTVRPSGPPCGTRTRPEGALAPAPPSAASWRLWAVDGRTLASGINWVRGRDGWMKPPAALSPLAAGGSRPGDRTGECSGQALTLRDRGAAMGGDMTWPFFGRAPVHVLGHRGHTRPVCSTASTAEALSPPGPARRRFPTCRRGLLTANGLHLGPRRAA